MQKAEEIIRLFSKNERRLIFVWFCFGVGFFFSLGHVKKKTNPKKGEKKREGMSIQQRKKKLRKLITKKLV